MNRISSGKTIDVLIDSLAYTGKRVARSAEKILFLDRGVPGDVVRARITSERRGYLEGTIMDILEPSRDRIDPPCPYYRECGGCHLQEVRYDRQLFWKWKTVESTLQRIGGFRDFHQMEAVIPSPFPLHYRNKAELHLARGANKTGLGFHHRKGDKILPVKKCLLLNGHLNGMLQKATDFFYHMPPDKQQWFSRLHIRSGEWGKGFSFYVHPGLRQDVKKLLRSFARKIGGDESISFIIDSGNPLKRHEAIPVKGTPITVHLVGPYRIQAQMTSFMQVNHWINRKMLSLLREMILEENSAFLLDCYCGAGNFGIFLSSCCERILGLEGHEPAVRDARENIRFNRIHNFEVFHAQVGEGSREPFQIPSCPGTVLLDPPRGGCTKKAVQFLAALKARRLIYVSCDPATMSRDLKYFHGSAGYDLKKVMIFDMFPQTYHMEIIADLRL